MRGCFWRAEHAPPSASSLSLQPAQSPNPGVCPSSDSLRLSRVEGASQITRRRCFNGADTTPGAHDVDQHTPPPPRAPAFLPALSNLTHLPPLPSVPPLLPHQIDLRLSSQLRLSRPPWPARIERSWWWSGGTSRRRQGDKCAERGSERGEGLGWRERWAREDLRGRVACCGGGAARDGTGWEQES